MSSIVHPHWKRLRRAGALAALTLGLAATPALAATTIDSGPSGFFNSTDATFAFHGTGATFQCALDTPTFTTCSSPQTYHGLAEGQHTFQVRGVAGGGAPESPTTRTWTVDVTAPDTSLTNGPPGLSGPSASWEFTSTETGSTFQCSRDGLPYSACTSPQNYQSLHEGLHILQVKATDQAGNTDTSAALGIWSADATPPETTITKAPSGFDSSTSPDIEFTSGEPGSTFLCSLDGAAATACDTPRHLSGLADGPHTFTVAAVDSFSNVDPTPATASWTLDSTPPDTTFTQTPAANTSSDTAHFKFETAEPKATFECSMDGDPLAACTSPQNFLSLPEGSHTFSVRALDAKGNADPTPATFQWTVDRTRPPAPILDIAPAPPIAPPNTTVIPLPRAKANPSPPPPTTVPTGPFTTGVAVLPGIAAFQTLAGMDVSWKAGPGSEPVTFDVHSGGSDMITGEGTFSGEGPVHKAGTDETHALATGSPGKSYCFNATATDLAGNYSPFGDAACTTLPLRAKSLGHTAGWTNKSGAAHYFGGYSEATHGALTFNAFRDYLVGNWFIPSLGGIVVGRVALVATRCKGCGKVKVTYRLWWAQPGDGTTKSKSVDLSSPSDMPRKVIPLWTFPYDKDGYPTQLGRHLQIKIEVTSARKPVRIEGLGVSAF